MHLQKTKPCRKDAIAQIIVYTFVYSDTFEFDLAIANDSFVLRHANVYNDYKTAIEDQRVNSDLFYRSNLVTFQLFRLWLLSAEIH